jgi:ATP-dependent Zn protease
VEVRRLVQDAQRLAERVLKGARDELDLVATTLLEREVLSAEELEALVARGADRSRTGAGSPGV